MEQKAAERLVQITSDIKKLKEQLAHIGREAQQLQQQRANCEGVLIKLSGAREVLEQLLAPAADHGGDK